MDNINVTVSNEQHKSNAPWILGIIGFVMSIPNILCATLCATVAAGASVDVVSAAGGSDAESAAAVTGIAGALLGVIISSIACFVLSFFGKIKNSMITGIIMCVGAVYLLGNALFGLGSWFWGTAAGVLYLIGGIFSVINAKRIA